MTKEEYIDFANALKNNYTIDFDKLPEFCDMAISALSAEGDLISKQKVLNTLDFADNALTDEERTVENYKELLTECIKVLSSNPENPNKCFDGMTNGEVLQALFPYVKTEDTSFNTLIGTNLDKSYVPLSREWWNSPYQKGGEE